MSDPQPPQTTAYSTKWTNTNFDDWKKNRNEQHPDNLVPDDPFITGNAEQLCQWLSFYVTETRSCKCEPYPPKSLYQLLSGLLRHCRSLNPSIPNFLDKGNPNFKTFHAVLYNPFKVLRKNSSPASMVNSHNL